MHALAYMMRSVTDIHFFSQKLMSTKACILVKRNKRRIDWFISPIPPITNIFAVLRVGKKKKRKKKEFSNISNDDDAIIE
jgi:hypothetical protein